MSRISPIKDPRPLEAAADAPPTDERSLDPEDWGAFRALCHEMLDAALDHLQSAGEGPVWRPVPEAVKAALDEPLPLEPQGTRKTCDDFRRLVLPYATGNTHPRFFGWVHGSGTAVGMLAEMLAGALNANLGGRDHGAIYVERQVIAWSRRLFGFPESASGLMVSGTSMATLIGLTVARNHLSEGDPRKAGLDPAGAPLIGYTSAEAHNSVAKAFEILGLGRERLRAVPVDGRYRMDCAALARMIAEDRAAGSRPFCVIGTAGTVNTGAIDDLAAIAELCRREMLWFHVDGAFGAAAMLSESLSDLLRGIEQADSLAFDFHKWFHVPYDAGCILVRDETLHRQAFSSREHYLAAAERGLAGGNPWYCEYGPELSRGFRALKVWFTLKEHGTRRLGAKVEDNCRQARDLAARVEAHPALELMAPVDLNIVCFRWHPRVIPDDRLDAINQEIVFTLQERGIAAPSTTRLEGRLAIRVNLTNHRSRQADLEQLVEAVLAIGDELAAPESRLTAPPIIDESLPDRQRAMIERACRRPELQPLTPAVAITIDPELGLPFKALRGAEIVLGPSALAHPSLLALHLRHALELTLLQRLGQGAASNSQPMAIALLACRCAALYRRLMIAGEGALCDRHLPSWLGRAFDLLRGPDPLTSVPRDLASLIAALLQLQGDATPLQDIEHRITFAQAALRQSLRSAGELAAPAEHLLASGGDARLSLDPGTGLNAYGCSPRPRPWALTFASSTATSISDPAYRDVEQLRQDLLAAALRGEREGLVRCKLEEVKHALLAACGAAELTSTEVILSTSGTDAELYALYFALGEADQELVNIVIAPDETGSGVVHAAGGRHFAPVTAFGAAVEVGQALPDFTQGRVQVETVAVRSASGDLRPAADVDREVEHLAEAACARGARVLLHLLDCSKTGWGAPSVALLRRLSASVDVVVDACQMRAEPESLRAYLEAGFMLQITGSKFFTGPPFSGALVLPPAIAGRAQHLAPLPASFADYTGRLEWPGAWERICGELPERTNLGLLARWTAALTEMQAFHAVPREARLAMLSEFAQSLREAMAQSEVVALCEVPSFARCGSATERWDRLTTILPFLVLRPGERGQETPLSYDEARRAYHWLNRDIASLLPDGANAWARGIAAKCCHIGQPVKLHHAGRNGSVGALRLCAGARIVSGTTFDPALGLSAAERLRQELDDARLVLDKIALIVEYWEALETADDAALDKARDYQV